MNVDKVVDARIRKLLQDRIKEYGNAKSAFANLDENPIWLNKEKGITIKRVSVLVSVKRNHFMKRRIRMVILF